MKSKHLIPLLSLVTLLLLIGCDQATAPLDLPTNDLTAAATEKAQIDGSYIVVLERAARYERSETYEQTSAEVRQSAEDVLAGSGIGADVVRLVYSRTVSGFSAEITAEDAARLADDPRVSFVEPDRTVSGDGRVQEGVPRNDPVPQAVPWGIERVGGGVAYTGDNVAWIIDTGIDLENEDLNVDVTWSANFVSDHFDADDDDGHGTHIAGTIAAIDNDIDVVGVAAGATVVPVKVLNQQGRGRTSWFIAGVDWVAGHARSGDGANLSLRAAEPSDALDAAVLALSQLGVYVTMSAGNESADAGGFSPKRVNGDYLYTVSAMDSSDLFASFSNYGNPPIDYCAPGVSVVSLAIGGGVKALSGTSMAAPHVLGLLLSTGGVLQTDGMVIGDPDGDPDPIAHR